jgi:hypothetical protein
MSVSWLMLAKANHEFRTREDYSMTILMSAMAVEAELARVFFKWTQIDWLEGAKSGQDRSGWGAVPRSQPERLEDEYRRLGTRIAQKIERVGEFLHPAGIDEFVKADDELRQKIETGYPSLTIGSLAESFQQSLFRPRNRFVHSGYVDHTKDEALRCYNIASLGVEILARMDDARRPIP